MTDMHLQTTVGPVNAAAGESIAVRSSRQSGMLTAAVSGNFQEAVLRGNCYTVTNQTGITSQAGLSATTPALTLFNPTNSGVRAVLWFAGAAVDIAFATTGAVWLASTTVTTAAEVTGTASTITRNCLLGGGDNPKINVFLAATLPAAPIAVTLLGMGLTGAITTSVMHPTMGRWFNGSVILGANTSVSIQTGVATGTNGLFCEYIWEEILV